MENRMYITVPIPSRSDESEIEPFKITVTSQSCSPQPFSLSIVSPDNRWTNILTLSLSDKDFASLKGQVLAADEERKKGKAAALAALKAELEPESETPEWEKELIPGSTDE
jgi:hypothetical protein